MMEYEKIVEEVWKYEVLYFGGGETQWEARMSLHRPHVDWLCTVLYEGETGYSVILIDSAKVSKVNRAE